MKVEIYVPAVTYRGVQHFIHAEAKLKKVTLNTRQTRSIRQGVQKALKMQHRIYEAAQMKRRPWALLEVFAGRATLSKMGRESRYWGGKGYTFYNGQGVALLGLR